MASSNSWIGERCIVEFVTQWSPVHRERGEAPSITGLISMVTLPARSHLALLFECLGDTMDGDLGQPVDQVQAPAAKSRFGLSVEA